MYGHWGYPCLSLLSHYSGLYWQKNKRNKTICKSLTVPYNLINSNINQKKKKNPLYSKGILLRVFYKNSYLTWFHKQQEQGSKWPLKLLSLCSISLGGRRENGQDISVVCSKVPSCSTQPRVIGTHCQDRLQKAVFTGFSSSNEWG